MVKFLFAIVFCAALLPIVAKDVVVIDKTKPLSEKSVILIIPGFGSINHGVKNIKNYYAHRGFDILIPDFISRKGIDECVQNLDEFVVNYQLKEYQNVHVLCYIIGGWTFNEWYSPNKLENLRNVIYDRSPLQERAPCVLISDAPVLWKLIVGKVLAEMCETPYKPIEYNETVNVGLLIETIPTKLISKRKKTASSYGPIDWSVEGLQQEHDDFQFIELNHDDLYEDFDEAGSAVFYFFEHGKFAPNANRTVPTIDPLIN